MARLRVEGAARIFGHGMVAMAMPRPTGQLTLRGWLFADPNVMRKKILRLPLLMFAVATDQKRKPPTAL